MAESLKKRILLLHGDSDYLIFKELKDRKTALHESGVNLSEFFGGKQLKWEEIYTALHSNDLFVQSSTVIVRDLTDGKSFFPYVEQLTSYISSKEVTDNQLILVHFGKVLKTSKLYKAILKVGEIKEFTQPKPAEILGVIKKSLPITDDAARLLHEFSTGNLFQIRNEVKKLQNYLYAKGKQRIEADDVELLCVKNFAQGDIWGVGGTFLHAYLSKDKKTKAKLLRYTDELIDNNIAVMQILYSCYQYTINSIKMKRMLSAGKSFRDCMALGYFFVKEFFDKRNDMKLNELMELNSKLLDFEYKVKSGEMDEQIGLRRLILSL